MSKDRARGIIQLLISKHGIAGSIVEVEDESRVRLATKAGLVVEICCADEGYWAKEISAIAIDDNYRPYINRPRKTFKPSTSDERIASMIAGAWWNKLEQWHEEFLAQQARTEAAKQRSLAACSDATAGTPYKFKFDRDGSEYWRGKLYLNTGKVYVRGQYYDYGAEEAGSFHLDNTSIPVVVLNAMLRGVYLYETGHSEAFDDGGGI